MALLKRNVALLGEMRLSPWRSLALVTWESVSDASIHAVVEMDAAPMLDYLEQLRERTGLRLSPVHFVGKALADTLHEYPDLNCLLRRGRLYRRRDVDIFFPVSLDPQGKDLSGTVIRNVDAKSTEDLARELTNEASRLKKKGDDNFNVLKGHILRRALVRFAGFFLYTLNLWSPVLGFPRDAFGSAAVTDLSSFGADYAFPPLIPMARLPIVIGVIGLVDRTDDGGKPAKWLRLCVVLDHRVIDGVYAGRMCRHLRAIHAEPARHLDTDTKESSTEDVT